MSAGVALPVREASSSYRAEIDVILNIARSVGASKLCAQAAVSDLDWQFFFEALSFHGLLPIIAAHAKECHCLKRMPAPIKARILQAHDQVTRQNLALAGELFKLQNALENAGVDFACFKGPTLAESLYGDITLRQFGDIDLFVERSNIEKVHHLLVDDGYSPAVSRMGETPPLPMYTWLKYEQEFKKGRTVVDLHWEPQPKHMLTLSDADLRAHVSETLVLGRLVPSFTPELQLLILCVHGFKSYWPRLTHLLDITLCVNRGQNLDWHEVLALAQRSGSLSILQLGLTLADRLYGLEMPRTLRAKLIESRSPSIDQLVNEVLPRFNGMIDLEESVNVSQHKLRFHLAANSSPASRLRLALKGVFKPTLKDWRAVPLPASLFWSYYLIRPCRLFVEAILRLLSR